MARRNRGAQRATVLNNLGSSSFTVTAEVNDILAAVHRELGTQFAWSYRKRETQLQTVAPYTTGTVAVTLNSATVTGTGTTWTAAMVSRAIRIPGEIGYFYVQAVASPTQITLGDADGTVKNWQQASAAGLTYSIFQHQYQVPANMALLLYGTRDWGLDEATIADFDAKDPQRTSTGVPYQWAWARANVVANVEQRWLELWPVPAAAYLYRAGNLIEPPDYVDDNSIPVMPSELIECETTIRIAVNLLAKTGDQRWAIVLGHWKGVRDGTREIPGLLMNCLLEDQQRWSLPSRLMDGKDSPGADMAAQRDWAVM